MNYPTDLSELRLLTEEQARRTVYLSILRELRHLRWESWKKEQTVESVLRGTEVEIRAQNLVTHLSVHGVAIARPVNAVPSTQLFEVPIHRELVDVR